MDDDLNTADGMTAIFELVRDLDLAFVDFGFVHTDFLN